MNEQSITLDLRKTGFGKRVAIRQNDYRGITLAVDVTDGGKAYSVPSSAKCYLMARLLGSYVRDGGCTVEGGRIAYTADERMFGASGTAEAYFRIEVDGAAYSTEGFQLVVERAADSYAQLSEGYDTKVDQAIRDAEAATAEANDAADGAKGARAEADAAAKKADAAAAKAEAGAGKVDEATDAATTAAEKAETAAQQATAAANKVFPAADNVLTGSASGAVAHAEDAFAGGALRGIMVEGACRQDGTPSPENPVPIEVIENPVVTLTGRNLLDFSFPARYAAYSNGVAMIYPRYLDNATATLPYTTSGSSEGFGFVRKLVAGKTYALKAFNLPEGKHAVVIAGYGDRADCISAGKSVWHETEKSLSGPVGFTVQEGGEWVVITFAALWEGGGNKVTYPADFKVSVELAEPTEYRPHTEQTRAFALPAEHPYLAKLPDGTADAIEVDEAGNAELVARVGKAVATEGNTTIYDDANGAAYANISITTAGRDSSLMCNKYVAAKWTAKSGYIYCPSVNGLIVRDSRFTSKDAAMTLLEGMVAYVNVPETRYALAPIDMPKAQDGTINAWTDAEVTPSTSIRYIRDVNTVVANLEAAIASIG